MNNYHGSQKIVLIQKYLHGLGLELKVDDNSVSISPLSSDAIASLSSGAVKKPQTYGYRSLRPERGGLFCERVFGPEIDWECACGKFRGIKYKHIKCDRCDVIVDLSTVRYEREGHIDLVVPVINPLFIDYLAGSLDMGPEDFRKSVYCAKERQNRDDLIAKLRSKDKEKDMILEKVVVIPPNLRPMVHLETGKYATADCNDLYKRVVDRNNRLGKLIDLNAPTVIIRNETGLLQQGVDALFMNESFKRPIPGYSKQPLRSISRMLVRELDSFFERTQDYSVSAIASFNPELNPEQCGLPEQVLLTLYQPLIIQHLKKEDVADTIKEAKKVIKSVEKGETENKEAVAALKQAIQTRPIIVTQGSKATALYPVVQEGESISFNAAVCSEMGLKLDEEKLNFYLPLSDSAVEEAKSLVGTFNQGDGQINSAFSTLAEGKLEGIVRLAITGEQIPLTELDKLLLSN